MTDFGEIARKNAVTFIRPDCSLGFGGWEGRPEIRTPVNLR